MKQIPLQITESKLPFILELIQNLDFVQIEDDSGDSKEAMIENLKQGLPMLN